jgi:hypothetical protein
MESFQTNPISLSYLLGSIHQRRLALPDFQRDFVWMPRATEQLIESIARSFPAGSLLFYPFQPNTFKPRSVENAPALNGDPLELVLDGQQRLTSLYQAFYRVGDHRYFMDLRRLMEDADVQEAVFFRHRKRSGRYASIESQAEQLVLPLGEIFGGEGFHEWREAILDQREEQGEDRKALRARLGEIYAQFVRPIEDYRFPVVTLSQETDIEAVCSIFETLNSTGVSLTVFELLTARYAARGLDLRARWEEARKALPLLAEYDVDPYYILQAMSLRERNSARRGDVLKLSVDDIDKHWDAVTTGCQAALVMLRSDCGVVTEKWLPYAYELVPMSATWREAIDIAGPTAGANRALMRRWFWCAGLSQAYDSAANTQAAKDHNELKRWFGGGSPPDVVAEFSFDPETLSTMTPRQQSAYKAVTALILRHGARDFHDAAPLTADRVHSEAIDDHHVFPRAYLNPNADDPAYPWETVDCILNRTMIDAATNRRIGKRAPKDYLAEIGEQLSTRVDETAFGKLLGSHLLPSDSNGPLLEQRFEDFLAWRKARLAKEVTDVTGVEPASPTP